MTTIHQKSPGLSHDLYKHMYDTLIKCNQFDTDEKLRSIFIDSRIAPWRNKLPQANDCDSRVLLIIDFLYVRHNTSGDNALVLFLHVLSERIDSGDALCCELLALAKEIEGSPPPPLLIPETVLIPAGDFCMGSEPGDPLAFSNETPRRRLNLPVYAIGKYPVTNAEYLDFVRANPRYTPSHWINDRIPEEKENHPVINVNLQNAQAYCQWLIEQTGRQYRLPTEEEWEKAARGAWPETRRYPWGMIGIEHVSTQRVQTIAIQRQSTLLKAKIPVFSRLLIWWETFGNGQIPPTRRVVTSSVEDLFDMKLDLRETPVAEGVDQKIKIRI
jgi:hypothetical protein